MRVLAILLLASVAVADEVKGRVTQVVADAIYVDLGSSHGVAAGDPGEILRVGQRIADVEVVTASGTQARLSILRSTRRPQVGDTVVLRVRAGRADDPESEAKRPPEERPFEPLLERQKKRAEPTAERNILHGRVTVQQIVQSDREGDLDYALSLLSSDGMFDRIAGSRWSLRWSANLHYRTGDAFEGSELEGEQLIVFDLAFARPVAGGGFVRFGRFLPRTLQSAGYFDGADAEFAVGANTRLGGAIGFKPTRFDLAPSLDEPAALVYASYRAGKRDDAYASGSYGLLASAWEGEFDRAALLIEQIAELGTARLDATATIDFDVGAAQFRSGTRLTQLDAFLSWRITRKMTLRGGADRWERLDNAAERERLPVLDPLLYEDGFWRSWVGAVFVLPWRLRLDLEYARIDSDSGPTTNPWRATLEHFGSSGGNVSLTVYGLESFEGDGYGGLLNGNLPLGGGKWLLQGAVGFRYLDVSGEEFDVTDVRFNVDYFTGGWQISGGLQWLGGTALDSLLFDVRVDYRF
ncbi:MAG: hypothetical protein ACYTHK_09805 [Planctomycetota bacterium]|jgi:hypothetical protein